MITAATIQRVAAHQRRRATEQIRARRAALAEQAEQAQAEYATLEQAIALLGRNIDAMHGGLQELDGLLAVLEAPA